ncbi:MAG: GH3 auxin-responsive promoter family protein [Moraxellaceae bacterium]|nr:GH3 auxin-responsive promoter family protein [Moraxellaceae bacterium]
MLTSLTHRALRLACWRADRVFRAQRDDIERVQRHKLSQLLAQSAPQSGLLPGASWEDFRDSLPLTRYADWQTRIAAQREGRDALSRSPLVRYQPTSGSSEKLKLIPYTRSFLGELDAAIAPWVASLYRQHPGLAGGVHYWSVSWLPESQRQLLDGNFNDDSELLGGIKRLLAARSQAVPAGVAFAGRADDAMFATLACLIAQPELRLLSVWSPTFALQMLEAIARWGVELVEVLRTGHWGSRAASLVTMTAPHAPQRAAVLASALAAPAMEMGQRLWPRLALVSAWDTADAAPWAAQLRLAFPQAGFEGKGLWATEGVVTIPYEGLYPLAYHSHVYEFERIDTGEVLAPWELREGDEVSPVLSAGNGLLRYRLDDRLAVTGLWGKVPCFQFLGRRFGVDLVGEKMSPEAARQVLAETALAFDLEPVSLLAVDAAGHGRSRYVALFGRSSAQGGQAPDREAIAAAVERGLRRHFHYDLARDLHQLEPTAVVLVDDGWEAYQRIAVAGGMIAGNIKPEPVRRIPLTSLHAALPEATGFFLAGARASS